MEKLLGGGYTDIDDFSDEEIREAFGLDSPYDFEDFDEEYDFGDLGFDRDADEIIEDAISDAFGDEYLDPYYEDPYDNFEIYDPPLEPAYPELLLFPLSRIGGLIRYIRGVDADDLTHAQAQNLKRFDKKLPKDAREIKIRRGRNGERIFQSDVPASNIPGSYARYEKIVDKNGRTISYTKTTYAPDGRIVHIKIK